MLLTDVFWQKAVVCGELLGNWQNIGILCGDSSPPTFCFSDIVYVKYPNHLYVSLIAVGYQAENLYMDFQVCLQ